MDDLCDLFLLSDLDGSSPVARQVNIFHKELMLEENKVYFGFLGLNLSRIRAVTLLTYLRNKKISSCNVPIRYRDGVLLSEEEAKALIMEKFPDTPVSTTRKGPRGVINPMYWIFHVSLDYEDPPREGSGMVRIDRLDGHIWGSEESELYNYDYNNLL